MEVYVGLFLACVEHINYTFSKTDCLDSKKKATEYEERLAIVNKVIMYDPMLVSTSRFSEYIN